MIIDKIIPPVVRPYLWVAAYLLLIALVARRFDLFTIWRTVQMPDGETVSVANGWFTVDHPFHISRAYSLIESLRSGELLRWFGQHQGGYPAEFYPTGAAWMDALLWAVSLGQLPIEVIHKLLITGIVLAPAFIFLWWARRDRISPGVAFLAGAGHVVIAGAWWSGGWTEIVLWGLVTNVAAQTAILGAAIGVYGWLRHGTTRDLGFAVLFSGIALGTNPRTALGLLAIGAAALIVIVLESTRVPPQVLVKRGMMLIGLSFAAAAPVIISLLRFRDLYYFVHYSGYSDVAAWWESSQLAMTRPLFLIALVGLVCGVMRAERPITRMMAIAVALYMVATAGMAASGAGFVDQLELTRLMPFQRMVLFYLAAIAVHDAVDGLILLGKRLARNERPNVGTSLQRPWICVVLAAVALGLVYVVAIQPATWVPEDQRGLRPMGTSAQAPTVDMQRAIETADLVAPAGTSILVLGTVLSWHQGLTAPMWSDRRFFYDDWLWYWQRDHVGPYNPDTEHAYPRDAATLTEEFLATHGIGAVVVTDVAGQDNRAIAGSSPLLSIVQQGYWFDVLTVREPVAVVTNDGTPADELLISNQAINARGESDGGTLIVRHNWHPRWQATINGVKTDVVKRADGYMEIAAPSGAYNLRLSYAMTWPDWLARALFLCAAIVVPCLVFARPESRFGRTIARWTGDRPRA